MEKYLDLSETSGVIAYALRPNAIIVEFADGGRYLYDDKHPGKKHVSRMKALAKAGRGLATYINQHVRENYAKKIR